MDHGIESTMEAPGEPSLPAAGHIRNPLRVLELRSAGEVASHVGLWRRLIDDGSHVEFFQTYEWIGTWLDVFWRGKPLAFSFLLDGNRPVCLLPLLADRDGVLGCANTLELPVNPHAERSGPLWSGDLSPVLSALASNAVQHRAHPIKLTHLDASSPIVECCERLGAADGCSIRMTREPGSPYIRVDGTWPEYLDSLSKHVKKELGRKLRKAQHEHRMEVRIVQSPQECERELPAILEIERKSWKQGNGSSFSAQPDIARFYVQLARLCSARGWFRSYLLYLGGLPAAHIFGVEYGNGYYALKTSYDEDLAAASPGVVLFAAAIEDAFSRRLKFFDLLGLQARWKLELANARREHVNVCLFAPTNLHCQSCRLLETHVKPFVRKQLSAAMLARCKAVADSSGMTRWIRQAPGGS